MPMRRGAPGADVSALGSCPPVLGIRLACCLTTLTLLKEMQMNDAAAKTVAIFNASEDTVEMLKTIISTRGYRAIDGHVDEVKAGKLDFVKFLEQQKPDALIWDISPPYDRNWHFFKMIRTMRPLAGCAMVLTTTHKRHLDDLAGEDTGAIEIVGKPYDLETIADAVTRGISQKAGAHPRAFGQGSQ
jgi:CheY-like chemotaxis protein